MTRIPFRSVGFVLAALFAGACTESTGPDGTPTDLTVRAYVDADGSGTFNAGDAPLAGMTVTATGTDGTAVTAQTDAQGAAVFAGLEPGGYTLSMSGTAPAGAVLATASTPVVVATSQGGAATAEFRYAYFPGTVSGVLYRDENGNGAFDAGTDLAAPGITVQLYAGSTATGTPVATTETSGAGAYSFSTLRPGTYTLRFVAPPGITIVGGADQQVTVGPNTPVSSNVRFTGNLTIPIATARLRPVNSTVTVEGVVTAGRGQLLARNLYIQDASGGIQVFMATADPLSPQVGDSIRVTGRLGPFQGEVQVTNQTGVTGTPVVEILGAGTPKNPRNVNGPDVVATNPAAVAPAATPQLLYEGQLVRVDSLEVLGITSTATAASVTVRTPQGNQFTVRLENLTRVPASTFTVGQVYTVTGALGQFNGTPNLKPRSTADVSRTSPPTIAEIKLMPQGQTATFSGVVTTTLGEFSVSPANAPTIGNVYVQDASGGIQVFGIPLSQGLVPGDSVTVSGTLGAFSGEVQVTTPNLTVTKVGTGTVPAPRVITGAQLASRAFEGSLVRVNDLVVNSVSPQSNLNSAYNVVVTAPDGTSFTVRVEGRTNLERTFFTVGATYDFIGIASAFTPSSPAGAPTVEQLKPRSTADVLPS